jgi:hypothetical protein
MSQPSIVDILHDPDTFATTACAVLMDKFGAEFLSWDPTALALSVRQHCGASLPPMLDDKIQAASVVLTTNLFDVSVETFTSVCNVFNGRLIDGVQFIPATLQDVMWGVLEAGILQGRTYLPGDFSHSIALYGGVVLSEEGIYDPPGVLRWVEYPEVNNPERAQQAFTNDVEYAVYRGHQDQHKKNLEIYGFTRLQDLFQQLRDLPLKNVDTSYVRDMQQKIKERLEGLS